MRNKKAQAGGLITSIVMGVAGLVIAVIIAFVIVSTLTGANLLTGGREDYTTTNESTGGINETGYILRNAANMSSTTVASGSFSLTEVWNINATGDTNLIPLANFTVSSIGNVTNVSTYGYGLNATISYTFETKATEELATERLSGNFTEGVDNVSSKIPTVLLIAAIVLILGVMVFLVVQWQRMRLGGGGSGTSL